MNEIDRREALKMLGLGLLSVGTGSAVLHGRFDSRRGDERAATFPDGGTDGVEAPQERAPWWLLAPFAAGSVIGSCRIASMTGVADGVVNLGLQGRDGERFNVTVCRRDDSPEAPRPVARTERYDLFLPNGGKGDRPTDEEYGRVVLALGILAERNEKQQAPLPLETLRQHWLLG